MAHWDVACTSAANSRVHAAAVLVTGAEVAQRRKLLVLVVLAAAAAAVLVGVGMGVEWEWK